MYAEAIILIAILYSILYYLTVTHHNFKIRELTKEYYLTTFINFLITGFIFVIFYKSNNNIFLKNKLPSIKNIVFYLLIVDAIFYLYHRSIHRTPELKKNIHLKHHNENYLLPLDVKLLIVDYVPITNMKWINMDEYIVSIQGIKREIIREFIY